MELVLPALSAIHYEETEMMFSSTELLKEATTGLPHLVMQSAFCLFRVNGHAKCKIHREFSSPVNHTPG